MLEHEGELVQGLKFEGSVSGLGLLEHEGKLVSLFLSSLVSSLPPLPLSL